MSPPLDAVILAATALLWVLATAALWMRQDRLRRVLAGFSAVLFSAAVVYASNVPALFAGGEPAPAVSTASLASGSGRASTMSCSEIRTGMKGAQVKTSMGKPDRIVSAEDRRGPTAELWIWDDARCRVYVFEDRVDFVE